MKKITKGVIKKGDIVQTWKGNLEVMKVDAKWHGRMDRLVVRHSEEFPRFFMTSDEVSKVYRQVK